MMDVQALRELFPITSETVFLNHAAIAPLPRPVAEACDLAVRERMLGAGREYRRWMAGVEETRSLAARLIGSRPEEIAFMGNTSEGMSTVANGLGLGTGDAVLATFPDFPSLLYPWMNLRRQGVRVDAVHRARDGSFGVAEVERALTPETRVLAVSSVDFATGFSADLEALGACCREHSLLFCVDGIQGLGVLETDVERCGIDFLASGGHKWLLGPMGTGFLFVSNRVRDRLQPTVVGWHSVENAEAFASDFLLRRDGCRFEAGTMNIPGLLGLGAALRLLHSLSISEIQSRVLRLNSILHDELSDRGLHVLSPMSEGARSGILSVHPPGNGGWWFNELSGRGFVLSLRAGRLRLAPHFYNDACDLERLLAAVDHLRVKRARLREEGSSGRSGTSSRP
jgi:cysteine desulfurase / selenocysteine lyase